MQPIPKDVLIQFDDILKQRNVPLAFRADYRKWLRYFLDYCAKYHPPDTRSDQVRLFVEKLRSKNQAANEQEQAADAVSLFFASQPRKRTESGIKGNRKSAIGKTHPHINPPLEGEESDKSANMLETGVSVDGVALLSGVKEEFADVPAHPTSETSYAPRSKGGKRYDEWRCLRKTESPAWDKVVEDLAAEIKVRHYSRKTFKHYSDWSRKFQSYLKHKAPEELSSKEVKTYLTYLAVGKAKAPA